MKAVILAAGEGVRMRPLTLKTPKPLLKVNGKPIIDYVLDSFPAEITEVIIVVKYLGNKIKKHVGIKNRGRKIKYVLGSDRGTAYSFIAAKKYLKNERFLFVYGDEIPNKTDVISCLKKDLSILTFKSKNPQANGIAYLRKDGSIKRIIEKPKNPKSNLATDGVMVLNTDIFRYKPEKIKNEYYFSTMLGSFVQDHKVFPIKAIDFIGDITAPSDLIRAGKIISARYNKKN
jgi:NDP-sugar pyrophosphorylase family protein